MLGMKLLHTASGVRGKVQSVSVDPAGKALVRIKDKWFLADECAIQE